MDSLYDLLAGKNFDEPGEIGAIKRYVRDTYRVDVGVELQDRGIVVLVPSAALASKLRYDVSKLQSAAETDKRISFRITG